MGFKKINKPLPGDLLKVRRSIGYYHFGIASSHDTVIHYSDFGSDSLLDPNNVKVIETSLKDFLRGGELEVVSPYDSPYSKDEVTRRAKSYLGQKEINGSLYNLIDNNCEHFARLIYYGKASSRQSDLGVLAAFGIAAAINKAKNKK